ncbi:MAG: DUF1266 domain-containing protein [Methylococcales bacterium]|jgi:hypothetical protein|nr:DUF1266 domain-containing protein [Methylococcales bacterium]MBT7444640.1 DUF1266 domain-containing protein [Methylococcales bacterium]
MRDAQFWALGVSAILTQMNGAEHDQLHSRGNTAAAKKDIIHSLKVYWSVNNREDLLENLVWLGEGGGHNLGFIEWVKLFQLKSEHRIQAYLKANPEKQSMFLVANYYQSLSSVGIRAWDDGRYVSLCRWGATAGYLTEDEAWGRILAHARDVQSAFTGWDQFAISYIAGKQYWQEKTEVDFLMKEMAHVTALNTDKDSPWVKLPWDLDLNTSI